MKDGNGAGEDARGPVWRRKYSTKEIFGGCRRKEIAN